MFGWIDDLKDMITDFFFGMLKSSIESLLGVTVELFEKSVSNVQSGIVETPAEFSSTLVETLRTITETAVLPVAGVLLTYVFCYEIYNLVVEKNRGNDFDAGEMFFLIFKTAIVILLVTNSFDITLAFFDLGQWMIDKIPVGELSISDVFLTSLDGLEDGNLGMALTFLFVAVIAMIASLFMSGIIYLVAWSRMVTIMLYISISPIPFATMMNRDWIGSIGQTYLKQIFALMLQGFFMMICLVIYAGLLEKVSVLITEEGATVYGLMLMLVSMGILVLSLTRTHATAKTILGVV